MLRLTLDESLDSHWNDIPGGPPLGVIPHENSCRQSFTLEKVPGDAPIEQRQVFLTGDRDDEAGDSMPTIQVRASVKPRHDPQAQKEMLDFFGQMTGRRFI